MPGFFVSPKSVRNGAGSFTLKIFERRSLFASQTKIFRESGWEPNETILILHPTPGVNFPPISLNISKDPQ
jgi:hypothetical protein